MRYGLHSVELPGVKLSPPSFLTSSPLPCLKGKVHRNKQHKQLQSLSVANIHIEAYLRLLLLCNDAVVVFENQVILTCVVAHAF